MNFTTETEEQIWRLKSRLNGIESLYQSIVKELSYFEDNDFISNLYKKYNNLLTDREPLKDRKLSLEKQLEVITVNLNSKISTINKKNKWHYKLFGPSSEMKELLDEKKNLEKSISVFEKNIKEANAKFDTNEKDIIEVSNDIEKFINYKIDEKMERKHSLEKEILLLNEQIPNLKHLFEEIKIVTKIDILSLNRFESDLKIVKEYDNKLTCAGSSYERKEIHDELYERYGNGSPREVIKNLKRQIQNTQRKILSTEKKIISRYEQNQLIKKISLQCKKIIIDGSNLCYKNGEDIIGLNALEKIVSVLHQRFSIKIIFDKSITKKIKLDAKAIKSKFPIDVEVIVLTMKFEADLLITSFGENNDSVYILSNDRYADYFDKEIVMNKRLIRHQITDERIWIPELSIELNY